MPAPIAHIVFALAYRSQHPKLDLSALVRGVTYPDVRRMAGIERSLTHRKDVTTADIAGQKSAWWTGWYLHSYMDVAWNEFFIERGLAPNPLMNEEKWRALKAVEEIIMTDMLPQSGRERLAKCLEGPMTKEELETGVPAEKIRAWYDFCAWRLIETHDAKSLGDRMVALGDSSREETDELVPLVEGYLADEEWRERLTELRRELKY